MDYSALNSGGEDTAEAEKTREYLSGSNGSRNPNLNMQFMKYRW